MLTARSLNIVSAIVSLMGGVLLATDGLVSAFLWVAVSLVWLTLAVLKRRDVTQIPAPARRLVRRFSRLLLFS